MIDQITKILEGHVLEALNKNKSFYEERIEICKNCTFFAETNFGPKCMQCGCRLRAKARIKNAKCNINKW